MKRIPIIFFAVFITIVKSETNAQNVAINNTGSSPDSSAILDVQSTTMGMLVPRMREIERMSISNPASGLLVYQADIARGFYYNSGLPSIPVWIRISTGLSGWNTTGNVGTDPANNFIGTLDNNPLNIRVNNFYTGQLHPGTGNVFLGRRSGQNNINGFSNLALGNGALYQNTERSNLVALGDSALHNNGTGGSQSYHGAANTAIGSKALYSNTIGFYNTSTGYQALYSNTEGFYNSAGGYQSLYSNTIGDLNTAYGLGSLFTNTSGNSNTATGYHALYSNNTGAFNVAIGVAALFQNSDRSNLLAIGDSALYHNGTGASLSYHSTYNTAVGSKALLSNNTGYENTAIGKNALSFNTSGYKNTANGVHALYANTIGYENTATGRGAISANTSGSNNTANGSNALAANTTGTNNTSIGTESLNSNTLGNTNTAAGYQALFENTVGYSNVAIGARALFNSTKQSNNVAVGDSALYKTGIGAQLSGEGEENTAIGSKALFSNTSSFSNTATGFEALYNNISSGNTAHGARALYSTINGQSNVAIGVYTLYDNTSGAQNTAIGANADINSGNLFNNTLVGFMAAGTANNQVRIGHNTVLSIGGFVNWSNISDGRFKKNTLENVPGLSFIQKLRPVTYTLDLHGIENFTWAGNSRHINMNEKMMTDFSLLKAAMINKEKLIYTGFVAQEVELAARELGFDFSGVDAPKNDKDLYGLRYAEFVVPLVKGMQEQQAMIEELKIQNLKFQDELSVIKLKTEKQITDLLKEIQLIKEKMK